MILKPLAFIAGLLLAATTSHAEVLSSHEPVMEHPMKVTFSVVPYAKMRYATVGDWQFLKDGGLRIIVARMSRREYEDAIALHEFVEAVLCRAAGISQETVDDFDMAYEKARKEGALKEPGDDPTAPYHSMHVEATKLERMLIAHYGLDWDAYNTEVESIE